MIRRTLAVALALIALSTSAHAATTFEYIFTGGYPLAISQDGTVIAGNNTGDYGPFRWTRSGGFESLGMASAPITGGSAGKAWVSYDGTRVASTIVGPDSTYSKMGLWTLGSGWQFLPNAPGGKVQDKDGGSIWGMSGDGNTAVGLFWPPDGRGHAYKWSESTGGVDLGSSGWASRANAANYDGSVIAGWDESVVFGYRGPAVWVNGQLTDLALNQIGEVTASNSSGNVIGGFLNDSTASIRKPTLWRRSGDSWTTQMLDAVPGTESGGINNVQGITADGNLAVGYCSFGGDPFYTTGFVWTSTDGTLDVVQFLANNGILPDPSFSIADLDCVTPDGTELVGWGRDTVAPNTMRAFMIHLDRAAVGVPSGPTRSSRVLSASPNPLSTASTLSFSLSQAGQGSLTIHDSAGRLVRTLASGAMAAGPHSIAWDGRDESGARIPAGVYFTQLVAGSHREMGKLVVVK